MVQTHTKLSDEKNQNVDALCKSGLTAMNRRLKTGHSEEPHSIDEVVVMFWRTHQEASMSTQELAPVYSFAINTSRAIHMDNLIQVQYELLFDMHFNYSQQNDCQLYEVSGQPGELFDFVVPVIYAKQGYEFFVFGNYLGGAMEDLQKNEHWSRVKAAFIALAIEMCDYILLEMHIEGVFQR